MPLHRALPAAFLLFALPACTGATSAPPADVRVATFNASLNRAAEGELVADLSTPDDPQAREVAEVVQRVRPDVLLVNEFDHAPAAVDLFRDNYLERGQNGAEPIDYPHAFIAPSNTGVPSGFDLDNDGTVGGGTMRSASARSPGSTGCSCSRGSRSTPAPSGRSSGSSGRTCPAPLPESPEGFLLARGAGGAAAVVEVALGRARARRRPHPPRARQPPDAAHVRRAGGPQRPPQRRRDRFWRLYVQPGAHGDALYDDAGRRGGLAGGERFVIMGDQNSDPFDGDSLPGATQQILTAHRVLDPAPASDGAAEAANPGHRGDPRLDTADFSDPTPGNLRVDYVLPSRPMEVRGSGVFWPVAADPLARLNDASDHHATWVDLRVR